MKKSKKDSAIDTADLPQNDVFQKRDVFQHPQPADTGKPLKSPMRKKKSAKSTDTREEEKTSKEQGLNETNSQGQAGAFEGFENQADS
ncbi:MAG: hypothetical protein ABIN01_12550 [Ferruginibacter sp.]